MWLYCVYPCLIFVLACPPLRVMYSRKRDALVARERTCRHVSTLSCLLCCWSVADHGTTSWILRRVRQHQENSIHLARLVLDMPDAARLPFLVWWHNDAPDTIKVSCPRNWFWCHKVFWQRRYFLTQLYHKFVSLSVHHQTDSFQTVFTYDHLNTSNYAELSYKNY